MAILKVFVENEYIQTLEMKAGGEYFVGRKRDCDVVLEPLPKISRKHLRIFDSGDGWHVECLSSYEHLLYQGEFRKAFHLEDGDIFTVAPYRLEFYEHAESHSAVIGEASDASPNGASVEATVVAQLETRAYLNILSGNKPETFRLEGTSWVLGRDSICELVVPSPSVSRKHFEISKIDNSYFVTDLGSSNGTLLNGMELPQGQACALQSGDVLQIKELQIRFEIRDAKFEEKLNEARLQLESITPPAPSPVLSPLPLPHIPGTSHSGGAIPVDHTVTRFAQRKRVRNLVAVALSALVLVWLLIPSGDKQRSPSSEDASPALEKLNDEQQRQVEESYKLAKNYYMKGDYELASAQLEKLHKLVPSYLDSRELEQFCLQAREIRIQQNILREQREEQARVRQKVEQIISGCRETARTTTSLAEVESCLSPAMELDPMNADATELIESAASRIEGIQQRRIAAEERQRSILAGQALFRNAAALHKKGKYFEALDAYRAHLRSGHPDPENLKENSKRAIASIESELKEKAESLLKSAREKKEAADFAAAIADAKQALDYFTDKEDARNLIHEIQEQLNAKLKSLYTDSVLEERFGNIEAAKEKWREILKLDVPNGDYRDKADRKLKQYGAG